MGGKPLCIWGTPVAGVYRGEGQVVCRPPYQGATSVLPPTHTVIMSHHRLTLFPSHPDNHAAQQPARGMHTLTL